MEYFDVSGLVGGAGILKVLHVISGLNVGGAELMLKRLIECQSKKPKYQHSVISLTDKGVLGSQLEAIGVRVDVIGIKGIGSFPIAFWRLYKKIRQASPDIVQTWMYHADLLGGIAARIAGVHKVIWGIRTTDLERGGKKLTRIIRRICAGFSYFVPVSIVCAAEASKRAHILVGYHAEKMVVVPNGFDLTRLIATEKERNNVRAECGFSDENLVIGSLGRYNAVKDQANFISATAPLAIHNPGLRFLMVGRGLDYNNNDLVQQIFQTGCPDRYVLLGERQDVAACLKAMDIFCLHSRTEGFPNVLGEAMAIGLPCVSTNVGDAHVLLEGLGDLVPPQDPAALSLGLQRMINHTSNERYNQGMRNRARILERYSMESSSNRFTSLYDALFTKS